MSNALGKVTVALLLSAIAALGAFGQAAGADDPAAVREAIEADYGVYVNGVESLDPDLWLTTWDSEGVKFMPNIHALVGKDAIAQFVRSRFALFESRKMSISVDAIDIDGDLALARGTYLSEDRLKSGGAPMITDGWFLTTFKYQPDGSWKIYRDCVGPNAPPK
jgi:ketosteroid isomerase-like protein